MTLECVYPGNIEQWRLFPMAITNDIWAPVRYGDCKDLNASAIGNICSG